MEGKNKNGWSHLHGIKAKVKKKQKEKIFFEFSQFKNTCVYRQVLTNGSRCHWWWSVNFPCRLPMSSCLCTRPNCFQRLYETWAWELPTYRQGSLSSWSRTFGTWWVKPNEWFWIEILEWKFLFFLFYSLLQSPVSSVLPLMVLGLVSVIGGLSVLMLPETGKNHLSDTLEEVEECIRLVKKLKIYNILNYLYFHKRPYLISAYRTARRKNISKRSVVPYKPRHPRKNNFIV